jgi:AraC family transcriptional regulator
MKIINDATIKESYIKRINDAKFYIDNNLDASLSIEKVTQVANYSFYHFEKVFKAATGETYTKYIIRKRIEKIASILIINKKISITKLASQYGFSSTRSFEKAFKKYEGVTVKVFIDQLSNYNKS